MKTKIKNIIAIILFYAIIVGGVILINHRIEETQKIDTEVSIIENR